MTKSLACIIQDIKEELEVLASRFGIRIIEKSGMLSIAT